MSNGVPRSLAEVLRDELTARDRIVALLDDGPKTIPEIAAALGAPSREVTHWVMAMYRYGALEGLPKPRADDYFRYKPSRLSRPRKRRERMKRWERALIRGSIVKLPNSAPKTSAPA